MTMLNDKTDLKLVIACQQSYLTLESVDSDLSCTRTDDFVITEAVNHLRGVVQTFFLSFENQQTLCQEVADYYDQMVIFDNKIPLNDLFTREFVLECGLKILVSPRSQFVRCEVM